MTVRNAGFIYSTYHWIKDRFGLLFDPFTWNLAYSVQDNHVPILFRLKLALSKDLPYLQTNNQYDIGVRQTEQSDQLMPVHAGITYTRLMNDKYNRPDAWATRINSFILIAQISSTRRQGLVSSTLDSLVSTV